MKKNGLNTVLYDRIGEAGRKKGFSSVTAVAVAAIGKSGTSAATRWNSGASITSDHLLKISRLLDVSVDYLLGNDGFVVIPQSVPAPDLKATVISQQETIRELTSMLSNSLSFRGAASQSPVLQKTEKHNAHNAHMGIPDGYVLASK